MELIATYWYLWLIIMVGGYGYSIKNQLDRMKQMATSPMPTLDTSLKNSFFNGAGKIFVSGFVGMVGMVLLIIAIIVNITSLGG